MKLKKYIVAGLIGIVSLGSCTYLDKEPDTEIFSFYLLTD